MSSLWKDSLKEFNKDRSSYIIPKKGTTEHADLLKIYEKNKIKSVIPEKEIVPVVKTEKSEPVLTVPPIEPIITEKKKRTRKVKPVKPVEPVKPIEPIKQIEPIVTADSVQKPKRKIIKKTTPQLPLVVPDKQSKRSSEYQEWLNSTIE